jgi:hypothetical protein
MIRGEKKKTPRRKTNREGTEKVERQRRKGAKGR